MRNVIIFLVVAYLAYLIFVPTTPKVAQPVDPGPPPAVALTQPATAPAPPSTGEPEPAAPSHESTAPHAILSPHHKTESSLQCQSPLVLSHDGKSCVISQKKIDAKRAEEKGWMHKDDSGQTQAGKTLDTLEDIGKFLENMMPTLVEAVVGQLIIEQALVAVASRMGLTLELLPEEFLAALPQSVSSTISTR